MYVQRDIWKDAEGMTFNATHRKEMDRSGVLLSMLLIMSSDEVSGYGQTGGDWRLLDKIGNVELIGNADRVIQSLDAKEHQYRGYKAGKKTAQDTWRNYASNTQFCCVPIILGRRWMDVEYGLDLAAWDQVELRVANTATSSTFTTNIALTAINTYLRDAGGGGGVRGYLKAEAHRDYVPVASAIEQINLPTEGRLAELLLHLRPGADSNGDAYTHFANLADLITLKLKSRAVEVMDHSAARLAYENWYDLEGEVITMGQNYNNADKGYDVGIGRVIGRATASISKDGAASATIPTLEDSNDNTQSSETYEADALIGFLMRGQAYQNILSLPVAWGTNPEQWLDLAANKQVTLDVRTRSTATVTSAKNRVLVVRPATGRDQIT